MLCDPVVGAAEGSGVEIRRRSGTMDARRRKALGAEAGR